MAGVHAHVKKTVSNVFVSYHTRVFHSSFPTTMKKPRQPWPKYSATRPSAAQSCSGHNQHHCRRQARRPAYSRDNTAFSEKKTTPMDSVFGTGGPHKVSSRSIVAPVTLKGIINSLKKMLNSILFKAILLSLNDINVSITQMTRPDCLDITILLVLNHPGTLRCLCVQKSGILRFLYTLSFTEI
jgi:hypothetical protein